MPSPATVRVALDWTPNTNHSGFYVARQKKFYEDAGLEVEFILPQTGADADLTPARMVARGLADFAVAPSESAISFAAAGPGKPRLVAVAALLQGSTSCVCAPSPGGAARPRELEGKRYASYAGRFEDAIVREMVRRDGGDPALLRCEPLLAHGYKDPELAKSSSVVVTELQSGAADATWIFRHWEGVLAERQAPGALNYFSLEDYGVPYGYSPVLLAHPEKLAVERDAVRRFLRATSDGYTFAADERNTAESVALLIEGSGRHESLAGREAFLEESQRMVGKAYLTVGGAWGTMEANRWAEFVKFLEEQAVICDREGRADAAPVEVGKLFSNEYLPKLA